MELDQETIRELRERGKKSLFFFARAILGFAELDPKIHLPACRALEDYEHNTRIVMVFPRTWFKSTIASIAYPIWRSINDPNSRGLIAQSTYDNACKKLRAIAGIFEKNTLFRALYADILPTKQCRWSGECLEVKRMKAHPEGTFEAAGVGTTTTSRHYDYIIQDDTIAPKKDDMTGIIQQPTQMDIEKAIGWHSLCHPMLLHPKNSQIVIVGTRWAERDLIGYIKEKFHAEYQIVEKTACEKDGVPCGLSDGGIPTWDRFDADVLREIEANEGPYMFACTPGHAGILMDDFLSKPIEDVSVGEMVVGFDLGDGSKNGTTLSAKVIAKGSRLDHVLELTMLSGRKVFCTADHRWLVDPKHKKDRPHLIYQTVCRLDKDGPSVIIKRCKIPGLHFVCEPDVPMLDDQKKDWARWLAGLYDGEGSCHVKQKHVVISQSQVHNPLICDGIRYALKLLNMPYNEHEKLDGSVMWTLAGGFETRRKFLHHVHPLKSGPIVESLYKAKFIQYEDKIIAVRKVGRDVVYWLETTSGNYVSQGYASKNCLYLNMPTAAINQVFKREWIRYYDNKPKQCFACTSVDLAAAEKEESSDPDYNVITTTAVDPRSGRIYVLEYTRDRMSPSDVINVIFDHYHRYHPTKVIVEAIGYQRVLMHYIQQRQRKQNCLFYIEQLKGYGKVSKQERIRSLQAYFSDSLIAIREGMDELEHELLAFPKGRHDDILDTLSMQKRFWVEIVDLSKLEVGAKPQDPFSGQAVIDELKGRFSGIGAYPYDMGNIEDQYFDDMGIGSQGMRRRIQDHLEESRILTI